MQILQGAACGRSTTFTSYSEVSKWNSGGFGLAAETWSRPLDEGNGPCEAHGERAAGVASLHEGPLLTPH